MVGVSGQGDEQVSDEVALDPLTIECRERAGDLIRAADELLSDPMLTRADREYLALVILKILLSGVRID